MQITKIKLIISTIFLSLILANTSYANLNDGEKFFAKQNYEKALAEFKPLAEQGNAKAQFNLAVMYYNGYGVKQNYKQAIKWWEKAAKQGNADAQNNLGTIYYNGYGVKQNYKKAIKWYELSAERGDVNAQIILAVMYYKGYGMFFKNYIKAIYWMNLARKNKELPKDVLSKLEEIWNKYKLERFVK